MVWGGGRLDSSKKLEVMVVQADFLPLSVFWGWRGKEEGKIQIVSVPAFVSDLCTLTFQIEKYKSASLC